MRQGNWDPNHLGLEEQELASASDFCLQSLVFSFFWLFLPFVLYNSAYE